MSATKACGIEQSDGWMQHMRRGDFEAAWRVSDRVLRVRSGVPCDHLPRHLQYFWDGRPLDGKRVLIRCYHGLGDTIQFVRYAPFVRARAREVILWVQPKLFPLFRSVPGIDLLLPLHDGLPDVDFDTSVEIMELPHVFRTTTSTIPGPQHSAAFGLLFLHIRVLLDRYHTENTDKGMIYVLRRME